MHRIYTFFFLPALSLDWFVCLHSHCKDTYAHNLYCFFASLLHVPLSLLFFLLPLNGNTKAMRCIFGTRSKFNRFKVCHLSCEKWIPTIVHAHALIHANVAAVVVHARHYRYIYYIKLKNETDPTSPDQTRPSLQSEQISQQQFQSNQTLYSLASAIESLMDKLITINHTKGRDPNRWTEWMSKAQRSALVELVAIAKHEEHPHVHTHINWGVFHMIYQRSELLFDRSHTHYLRLFWFKNENPTSTSIQSEIYRIFISV